MRLARFLVHSLGILTVVLLLAPFAAAQQYSIVRAEYGAGPRHVDVTQRLREVARTRASFPVSNDVFGIDPAPGQVKTLRIFGRGPGGETQVFEFRENEVVDGGRFVGWREGAWGGPVDQYDIVHALYGVPGRFVDVTPRLRELARRDTYFKMGNDTFGIDPAPGVVKTLRIFARGHNGEERTFDYRENSVIDGSIFSGWGSGNWGNERWDGDWDGRHR